MLIQAIETRMLIKVPILFMYSSMMETKERKLRLRRERERASRANKNEEQKKARTSLAQLMLHEHFLVIIIATYYMDPQTYYY